MQILLDRLSEKVLILDKTAQVEEGRAKNGEYMHIYVRIRGEKGKATSRGNRSGVK